LALRPVTKDRDRARALAAQLPPPRKPRGVRDMRPDRDADGSDVVVDRVPPAGGMATPPGEDRRGRHPAQQPDRRLAVARKDPVVALECVDGAGLHRLVIPEDRVGADPALAVMEE